MSRKIFIKKLMSYLKNISESEREEIKEFYDEMFDEAGIEIDDEVPESFGDPRKIAMEILADSIEFDERRADSDKKSDRKSKKNGFFKKLSVVFLGLLSLPIILPIFIIFGVFMAISLVIGVIGLVFSIITLPITIWFAPFYIFKIIGGLLLFAVLGYVFYLIVKVLYKFFIKDISNNPNKYSSKYFSVRYYDDMEYENKNFFENENKTFENIESLECNLHASNVIFELIEGNKVSVDASKYKNSELMYSENGGKLKIENKKFISNSVGKTISLNEKYTANMTLKVYIPRDLNFEANFDASNINFKFTEFNDCKLTFNASNVNFKDAIFENVDMEINASNVNGNVDFERMDINANASNVSLKSEKNEEEVLWGYSAEMSKVKIFGNSFIGFGGDNFKRNSELDKARLYVKCSVGSVTIR